MATLLNNLTDVHIPPHIWRQWQEERLAYLRRQLDDLRSIYGPCYCDTRMARISDLVASLEVLL